MPALVNALNSVDFPTFGKPTIPHFKLMTASQRQAGKCMPRGWRGLWAAFVLAGCAFAAVAATPSRTSIPAAPLTDQQAHVDAQAIGSVWLDARGNATLEQLLQGTAAASFE